MDFLERVALIIDGCVGGDGDRTDHHRQQPQIRLLFLLLYVFVCAYGPSWPSTLRSGAWIEEVHAAMTITQGAWRYI